jgi:hypothetical protein
VVGIIGARQVGKTTLARAFQSSWNGESSFFDLEDPKDLARVRDPMLGIQDLRGLMSYLWVAGEARIRSEIDAGSAPRNGGPPG